jgi:hypothetical protein
VAETRLPPESDTRSAWLPDAGPQAVEDAYVLLDAGAKTPSTENASATPVILTAPEDGTKAELLTCVAHLYGQKLNGSELNLVENIHVKNPAKTATNALFAAQLQGYSATQVTTLSLPAGQTINVPPHNVTFDFPALYKVSAPVTANFTLSLSALGSSVPWDVKSTNVLIYPKNTILWGKKSTDGSILDLRSMIGVFVTPHDQAHSIDQLLKSASKHSSFGSMLGYQYMSEVEKEASWKLAPTPSNCQFVSQSLIAGHAYTLVASSSCPSCTADNGYAGVYTQQGWETLHDASSPIAIIQNLGTAKTTFKPESTGTYIVAACNPNTSLGTRTVQVSLIPPLTSTIGAYDQVAAIFLALKELGLTYVSVATDFFDGAQNVKFPSESLATTSANCIDGSLVFASALEAIGMRPAIVMLPGHAIAAVLVDPDADPCNLNNWLAIETTVVANATPAEAITIALKKHMPKVTTIFAKGCTQFKANQVSTLFDVQTLREIGFLPAPM